MPGPYDPERNDPDDRAPDTADALSYAEDFTGNRGRGYEMPGQWRDRGLDAPDVIMGGYATRD